MTASGPDQTSRRSPDLSGAWLHRRRTMPLLIGSTIPAACTPEFASQVGVDDVLAANGWIQPLPVECIAFHDPGIVGFMFEVARVTQEERQIDVLVRQHPDGPIVLV